MAFLNFFLAQRNRVAAQKIPLWTHFFAWLLLSSSWGNKITTRWVPIYSNKKLWMDSFLTPTKDPPWSCDIGEKNVDEMVFWRKKICLFKILGKLATIDIRVFSTTNFTNIAASCWGMEVGEGCWWRLFCM